MFSWMPHKTQAGTDDVEHCKLRTLATLSTLLKTSNFENWLNVI